MANDKEHIPGMWKQLIDNAARESGHGSVSSALAHQYWGLNKFSNRGAFLPGNRDVMGYTFFTRPILNLSHDNLMRKEKLLALATNNPNTIPGAIRSMFDSTGTINRNMYSDLFDNSQAFMPIFSNTLESMTGFPDIVIDMYTAPAGSRKETWTMVDSQSEFHEAYNVTSTHSNIQGDPVTMCLDVLQTYASGVYLGEMIPYWDAIVNNYIDYTVRFYRIVLDQTYRYVTKIGAPYAAIAGTNPISNSFDFNSTNKNPLISANASISCQWSCVGWRYNSMSVILDFNATVELFNEQMKPGVREKFYRKLTPDEYQYYNYVGYPYIDVNTNEFQWWVPNESNKNV